MRSVDSRERPVVNVIALNFGSNLCQDSSGTMMSTQMSLFTLQEDLERGIWKRFTVFVFVVAYLVASLRRYVTRH